jgi:hypothetical protein
MQELAPGAVEPLEGQVLVELFDPLAALADAAALRLDVLRRRA